MSRRTASTPAGTPLPFLRRLLRDRAANTLVIMATALIPLSALAGSAVDMARLYVVKSRLQQACDAGVLAGRKFMATSTSSTLDATATTRAKTFFNNNFVTGWLDTGQPSFVPVKTADQQVSATASVRVPMTVMKMFAAPDVTINVACKARYDIADTDIVFVLDTTGSMACRPEDNDTACGSYTSAAGTSSYTRPSSDPDAMPGYLSSTGFFVPESTSGNGSRIRALRQAVKDFYATIAANVDSTTRVRYGFVTYTSTVNAGKAISQVSPAYLMGGIGSNETAEYQSRKVTGEYLIDSDSGTISKSQNSCNASAYTNRRTPNAALTFDNNTGTAQYETQEWSSSRCRVTTRTVGPQYTYKQYDWNVSQYVTGALVDDPTRVQKETSRWEGCIEERQTEAGVTSFGANSLDLDPDLIPTSAAATRWKPMWPDVTYARYGRGSLALYSTADDMTDGDVNETSRDNYYSRRTYEEDGLRRLGYYSCGKPIHRLSEMTAAQVAAYVDAPDFRPLGGTYHDTGMIWGVRMLSTRGIFAADNTARSGQPMPRKVLVFLTDGDMSPNQYLYGLYGVEYLDRRVSGGNFGNLKNFHNARFVAMCDRARSMGIDVWTVAIGLDSTDELTDCARNSSQALATTSGSGLSAIFQQIAKQVAMLRMEQ